MHTSFQIVLACLVAFSLPIAGRAQVNSGSNGSDGAFNPTTSVVIDMSDHADGIYQYTSVNIPSAVTVTFKPNAKNTPVIWLVQGSCVVNGTIDVSGANAYGPNGITTIGGSGGPGGWPGGNGGGTPTPGQGPGGGLIAVGGSFGSQGADPSGNANGQLYGNSYLLPLQGGSGGGGNYQMFWWNGYYGWTSYGGGGGGGGAILLAASNTIEVDGTIRADGGTGSGYYLPTAYSGGGSGGGIRLVAATVKGTGALSAQGSFSGGGKGWVRIDMYQNSFAGGISGAFTQGFQPIILPAAGQGVQMAIASIGGVAVAPNPGGVLANPDVIIGAQHVNPISVVINCTNIPLNTSITVMVQPANGAAVTAVGLNNVGTLVTSTATIPVNMPRGGGIIYATAVTGLGAGAANGKAADPKNRSLAETGWTASGERFVAMELTAALGGKQRISYITQSGKRYPAN